ICAVVDAAVSTKTLLMTHCVASAVAGWPRPTRILTAAGGAAVVRVTARLPASAVAKFVFVCPLTATVPVKVFVDSVGWTTVGCSGVLLLLSLVWHAEEEIRAARSAASEMRIERAGTKPPFTVIIRR